MNTKIHSAIPLIITVLAFASGCDLLYQKERKFQDVSTKSTPYDLPTHNGAPCSDCTVSGPFIFQNKEEYGIGKAIVHSDGSRADITWWAPRDQDEILSIQAIEKLPWRFREASFQIPDLHGYKEWQKVIEDLQKLNGSYSGRSKIGNGKEEIVYWGKVSVPHEGEDRVNCATDCLVIFGWGNDASWSMTAHLSGKMRRAESMALVP